VKGRLRAALRALARSGVGGSGARARGWMLALVLVAAALVPGLLRLDTDNSPHVFYVEGSERVLEHERFVELLGSDKAVRIVLEGGAQEGEALWSAEGLDLLRRLEQGAGAIPGVLDAGSLYGHATAGRSREWPPSDPGAFRRRSLGDPLAVNLGWVSGDGGALTVLAVLDVTDNRQRTDVLAHLEELVARELDADPRGVSAELVGGPVLDRALDRATQEVDRIYFPFLVALTVVLLVLIFRSVRAVVAPLAFVAFAELLVLGSMGWWGVELNLVLAVLPPLLFVIALATAVHLLVRCRDFEEGEMGEAAPSGPQAIERTYRDKGWAVLWTGLSTLVGFASLAVSPVGPVRSLGIWAGLGIAAMTALAFGLYPALLSWTLGRRSNPSGQTARSFERWFQRAGRRWAGWAAHHRSWVLGIAAATAVAALAGVPFLELETNALHYLHADHPVRMGIEDLESRGVGTSTVELMLTLPEPGQETTSGETPSSEASTEMATETLTTFESLTAFRQLATLTERLREEPHVLGAVSPGDLFEDAVRQAPGGALFGASAVRRVAFDRLTGDQRPEILGRFLADEGRVARVTLFVPTLGSEAIDPLLERAPEVAREAFPQARVTATGELPLVLESQRYLLSTLGLSLSLTFVVIALIFRALLPSTRLTLLALVPNLWPVVGVVGLMGWLGIPLDVATVMVASVVLGLAVDDTIHTLGHFRELAPERGRFEAVAGTLERAAPAYVLTGLILGAGFGVCAFSEFAPTARFGALSACAIALAVLGDLFLLPALLGSTPHSVVRRLGKGSGGISRRASR